MRRLAPALFLALAALLPAAAPAGAALPGHSGTRGDHVIIDSQEYPGIICQYTTSAPGRLKRISVRRPIVYAPDSSARRDHRWVGWRYRIQRSTDTTHWSDVFVAKIKRAVAYDDQPAVLLPSGKDLTGESGSVYRARVELWWWTPSGTTNVTGRATHIPERNLQVFGDTETKLSGPCPGSLDPASAAAARSAEPAASVTHGGDFGLHALVDGYDEFQGAICRLQPDGDLRITVRAPAVFAVDGTSGSQQVRWRYRIEGMPPPTAGPVPVPPYAFTSTWATGSATEDRAARWAPLRSTTVPDAAWPYYLVSIRMEWVTPGTNPYAIHAPFHKNGNAVTGYCLGPL